MPLYIWNRGSPLVCSNIFGTEEVTNHDAITKKAGKFKLLGSQMVAMDLFGLEKVRFFIRFFPFSGSTGSGNPEILADSERACQDG